MLGLPAIAIAWVYARTMAGLGREWGSSPDASYGLVLAGVALLLFWQQREAIARAADAGSRASSRFPWSGLALLVAGLLTYLIGQLGADIFLTRVSLVVVIAGALWFVAGGRAARVAAAPLVFLLMAVPLPALVVNAVTLPLQLTASRIAEATLSASGIAVFRDGNVLELPSASLEVAEACSGLRSLVSLTAIAGVLAWAAFMRMTAHDARAKRAALARGAAIVAMAVPIAIVMNGLRIAAVGIGCELWDPRVTSGGWHTFTGWITFVASVGVLLQLQKLLAPRPAAAERVDGAMAA